MIVVKDQEIKSAEPGDKFILGNIFCDFIKADYRNAIDQYLKYNNCQKTNFHFNAKSYQQDLC
jgi:hypothetical protein